MHTHFLYTYFKKAQLLLGVFFSLDVDRYLQSKFCIILVFVGANLKDFHYCVNGRICYNLSQNVKKRIQICYFIFVVSLLYKMKNYEYETKLYFFSLIYKSNKLYLIR